MYIDFRKCRSDPTPVCIQGERVERVSTYLGVFDKQAVLEQKHQFYY